MRKMTVTQANFSQKFEFTKIQKKINFLKNTRKKNRNENGTRHGLGEGSGQPHQKWGDRQKIP